MKATNSPCEKCGKERPFVSRFSGLVTESGWYCKNGCDFEEAQ